MIAVTHKSANIPAVFGWLNTGKIAKELALTFLFLQAYPLNPILSSLSLKGFLSDSLLSRYIENINCCR